MAFLWYSAPTSRNRDLSNDGCMLEMYSHVIRCGWVKRTFRSHPHKHTERIFLTAQTMVMMTEEDRWDWRLGWVDETLMDDLTFCLNTKETTVANVSLP